MCDNTNTKKPNLHIAFYPWFAFGHITPFLHLANKIAQSGHKVSFFLPIKTRPKFDPYNHHPNHLTFIPITFPVVSGLPPGAETTNDVSASGGPLIMSAMDMTRDIIEAHLVKLKPNVVLYDFTYWMPELARLHGFKAVHYITANISRYAYVAPHFKEGNQYFTVENLTIPPPGFPSGSVRMQTREAQIVVGAIRKEFGLGGLTLAERLSKSFAECDGVGVKSCKEMEGDYAEYFEKVFGKPVFLAGPMVPRPPCSTLDQVYNGWLNGFGGSSVIYCALGSECVLEENQFHELLLGLELTGRPFLTALKAPKNYETIELALPKGLKERIKGRGMIDGGWVQQQLILQHPSVGCFITHCGIGSMSEALVNQCQIVMMPQAVDQFFNARMMSLEWKIGVEIEQRESDGFFTKEALNKAVSMAMEEGSEVGREIRANHTKWRDFILKDGLEDSYISSFIESLHKLIG